MTTSASQRIQKRFTAQAEPIIGTREGASGALSSNAALAEQCVLELGAYRRGEPCDEAYGLELFRRATVEGDPEAWVWVQRCFGEMVLAWLRRHSSRAAACHLESEENYVALTFERFWQATALTRQVSFRTLAAALQYLRASLHGAILDTLRAYSRLKEVSLPEPGQPGEPGAEDQTDSLEVWEILQTMLSNRREQRLAYLLYHCGLKPREIVRFCPQEWSDVQEIYRLRRNILERLMRTADQLRWRLNYGNSCEEYWME
jgi:DNA-directed RNA polymerase specialized sigma24 family protein